MLHLLCAAALAPLLVTADLPETIAKLPVGTQLTFRGTVGAQGEDPLAAQKTFDLRLWITTKSATGGELFWLLDERGPGEFSWSERFGRLPFDARWRSGLPGPALLYDRGEAKSVIHIPLPFLVPEKPLAVGVTFQEQKLEYTVDKPTKAGDRAAWYVSVRDSFGPKRTLRVDQQSPLVLTTSEKLTLGRGEQYQLTLDFVTAETLTSEQLAALTAVIEGFTALDGKLNLPAESQEIVWKPEQLEVLRQKLPELAKTATGTPLADLAATADRDLQLQSGRTDAVASLAAKFTGQPVADFSIRGLGDAALSLADLKGHVTVLHFWDYRDEPLKEPYGQVGYLDFMYQRRKAAGMRLYGVAVNSRLGDDKSRGSAERSVKKLQAFMNLGYPILLDAGGLLKQFGDPRVLGANLPLFVVIGPDQKILHYHVGTYEVSQDQGLKELDAVVSKALETSK